MNWLTRKEWSPYVAGGLSGINIIRLDRRQFFRRIDFFIRTAGLIENLFGAERVD